MADERHCRRAPDLFISGRIAGKGTLLSGVWTSAGPGPSLDGQTENITPTDEVVSAMHTLVVHPTDPDIIYVDRTNSGVWKTTNATAVSPNWSPLNNDDAWLSIGALEFDPTDATHQTLVADIRRYSSFGQLGGNRTGMLYTSNSRTNWTAIDGGGTLISKDISGIAVRGNVFVVSVNLADSFSLSNLGIFHSTDGGASFSRLSTRDGSATGLPGGTCYDLAADPSDNSILYTSRFFRTGKAWVVSTVSINPQILVPHGAE